MNKCIFFALITSKRPDHGRSDLLRLILSFTSLLKFKIARDISYIHTVESTQILFVAKEMLFCGEMAILRTLCRTCGARARVRINVQMDCHTPSAGYRVYVRRRSVIGRAALGWDGVWSGKGEMGRWDGQGG